MLFKPQVTREALIWKGTADLLPFLADLACALSLTLKFTPDGAAPEEVSDHSACGPLS